MPNFFQRSVEKKKKQVGLATKKNLALPNENPQEKPLVLGF
jgi:hypothetical protein